MTKIKDKIKGILVAFILAVPSYYLGKLVPTVGGPVFSILIGMIIAMVWKEKGSFNSGIKFTSKYILQTAVVLLGFGLNLRVILETGKQSLPIIVSTIATSLTIAYILKRTLKMDKNSAILIGVGSSICGGSAISATAPVINAKDEEIAQAISVVFIFNVLAAVIFPLLATKMGMNHVTGDAFGIFAGTAVNDTSSVTAASSTWDNMWKLGTATLDKAVTVKLTRTLAIIPITLVLGVLNSKKDGNSSNPSKSNNFSLKRALPKFIIWFILASIFTTVAVSMGLNYGYFSPLKNLSKFFIIMSMGAIGLNTDIVSLVKSSGKPILLGAACWIGITAMSLSLQYVLGIW